jgi:hypothetical protein
MTSLFIISLIAAADEKVPAGEATLRPMTASGFSDSHVGLTQDSAL